MLFAAFPAQHFPRTATNDKIANSGVRLQEDIPDMARQSHSTGFPQASASLTKSSFRHSFACFPKGVSPSRGPGISSVTWTCSSQQLQAEERSLAFPTAPPKARDHQVQHV